MLISVHVRYHRTVKGLIPLHLVFLREENGAENSGNVKFHHMSMVGFIATCSAEKDMRRSQQEGFSPLDASIHLATQILTATSLLTQGQAHHHVILKLGTLILLTVWTGEATQSINKSKVTEASRMYQQRQLKNNPSVVFFSETNGIFSSSNLTVRMLSCSLHWET